MMTQFPDNKGTLRTSVVRHVGESGSKLGHLPLRQPLSAKSSSETRAVGNGESFGGHLQVIFRTENLRVPSKG